VKVIEIAMNTPNALQHVDRIKQLYPDAWIGVGTVLDETTARSAIAAGASFLLSPALNKAAIQMANRYNIPFIPGVLTATEIMTAYEFGAKVVKVFPIDALGPNYVKNISAPLPHVELIPMGGISQENAIQYLEAGSFALGIGSSLVNSRLVHERNFAEIERRARRLVDVVEKHIRDSSDEH
jgi:2-dehydro-3-deoxyphosphogluconate aldolase/(4S)-4-hydroxy-2-oxoglutarate aldolase